jgi:peptidoglycan/xylan/chitin deacetylase (PgdA/CDA1 family)
MFRALVKTGIACAYTWSGAGRRSAATDALPFIVGYHRVVANFAESARRTIPSMLISAATFEKHLDWLARRFEIVPLDEIGRRLENGVRSSRPVAAITFDDGYADVYHNAFPILKRKGIPAAVFVVTKLIGTAQPQIYDRLYMCLVRTKNIADPFTTMTSMLTRLPQSEIEKQVEALEADGLYDPAAISEMAPLSWEMIEEMQRAGIEIGSHTRSHVLLTCEQIESARQELIESKTVLEDKLKRPVHHFAYPDGRWNPAVLEAVKSAGYKYGYTICTLRDPRHPMLTIPRKMFWERACANALGGFSGAVMNCHARGLFDRQGTCEHDHSSGRGVAAA